MADSLTKKRLRGGLTAGLAGALLALGLWALGLLGGLEAKTYDWRVRLLARPSPATDAIRLILLDQDSLDWGASANGLSWPWPREVYAAVVDFCARAQAAALAFDVLTTEPSKYGVADDTAFGQSGAAFGRLVLPVFLGQSTGRDTAWPDHAPAFAFAPEGLDAWLAETGAYNHLTYPRAAFPVPEIAAGAALLGNVHLDPDPDGIYRRATLFARFDGKAVPGLPLSCLLAAAPGTESAIAPGTFMVNGSACAVDENGRALIRYRGPGGTYKAYAAAAVIQSELKLREGGKPTVDPEDFKGKYVLFGFTAPGLFDLRPAPVGGVYTGVEIHASVLDNMLAGDFLRGIPEALTAAYILILSLAAGAAVSLVGPVLASGAAALVFLPLPAVLSVAAQAHGFVLPLVPAEAGAAGALAIAVMTAYATEGRQRRFLKHAFRQYLSPEVIEQLIAHPERMKLGGEKRVLSIFFSDLQGFTGISEGLSPEELTTLLNDYLSAMTDIILAEGGTVDKYEGDAIIAFWNAPVAQADHAARCLRAALRCQETLTSLRPAFKARVGKDMFMRVGINTGPAVVGNMGSSKRFDYTMLGDAVNLASRLEGVNKQFGTFVMISKDTLDASGGAYPARELGRVAVVGRCEPVTVFEPMTEAEYAAKSAVLGRFAEGLGLFYEGRFAEAEAVFAGLAEADPPSRAYAAKCRAMAHAPAPQECGGVWVMTEK